MNSVNMPREAYSRRLPPPDAWKDYDKWVDPETGLARKDVAKITLETDDRGFLFPEPATLQVIDQLFWEDYDWPFDPRDPQTAPDDHHFHFEARDYAASMHGSSPIPRRFRELPTLIGREPRQLHNAMHDFTNKPDMPEFDAMKEYIEAYKLAVRAFQRLSKRADKTIRTRQLFNERRRSVAEGRVSPADPADTIGMDFLRSTFERVFGDYSKAIEDYEILRQCVDMPEIIPDISTKKPDRVVRLLGRNVKKHVNLVPLVRGEAA